MGATGRRENMSNCVQILVKFVYIIMYLNEIPRDDALLVYSMI